METTNRQVVAKTRSIGTIVKDNICTLFNLVNFVLALLIIYTGSYQNLLFVGVVIANLTIALYQEIRAKRLLDKLRLEVSDSYRVFRQGKELSLQADCLQLGDSVELRRGQTIPCDMKVLDHCVFVNESLLTGESKSVQKEKGAELISGSFITAGSCKATCIRVGEDTYLSKMNGETKSYVLHRSPLYEQLSLIIRVCSIALIPIGLTLFIATYLQGSSVDNAILSSAGAMIGMIPQGLVLLTSTVFAVGAQILAQKHVFLQNLYATDLLGSLDTLVFDKTGTITSEHLVLCGFYDESGKQLEIETDSHHHFFQVLATIMCANADDVNKTTEPLVHALRNVKGLACKQSIPFSSETKHSGCVTNDGTTFLLGAPRYVCVNPKVEDALLKMLDARKRILFVTEKRKASTKLLGAIVLQDQLRDGICATIQDFREAEVAIKVVSGDGVEAVSAACEAAGVNTVNEVVDLSKVTSDFELRHIAQKASIYARALPSQKQSLIKIWKENGNQVGMVGDGVNDVMALKSAHCAISIQDASQAAQAVSDVLLLDNDISGILTSLQKGRIAKNNLQCAAALFLEKTVLSMLLALFCIVFPPFLFVPIQLSLISATCIGIPSFVIGLWPMAKRTEGSFLQNALQGALPSAFAIFSSIVLLLAFQRLGWLAFSFTELSTGALTIFFAVGMCLVLKESVSLRTFRTPLVAILCAFYVLAITLFGWFFQTNLASFRDIVLILVFALFACGVFVMLDRVFTRRYSLNKGKRDEKEK